MRNSLLSLVVFGIGVLLLSPSLFAENKITPRFSRTSLIQFTEEQMNKKKSEDYRKTLIQVENPFRLANAKEKEGEQPKGEVVLKDLSDEEILAAAAQKIKPTGSLLYQGHYRLLIGGDSLGEGDPITMTYAGKSYDVYIDKISQNEYILRLGKATMTKTLEQFTSGSIEWSHPQSK